MKLQQAYRFVLEPSLAQVGMLQSWQGPLRFVWNWMLQQRRDTYRGSEGRVSVSYEDQANQLPALKLQYPFVSLVPASVLQQCLVGLDKAFVNFFEGRGKYPRWKKADVGSLGVRNPDAKQFRIKGKRIFLPKLKWVKLRLSRKVEGTIKNATVTHDGLRWHVSIQTEREVVIPSNTGTAVGIDAGVTHSYVMSSGKLISLPVATSLETKKLAKLARSVSRKVVGSNRHKKAKRRALIAKRHISARVQDARHKLTAMLAKNHSSIVVEDLNLKNMTASAKGTIEQPGKNVAAKSALNRSLLEQGHAETYRQLAYKTSWYGGKLIKVNPAYTSQRCSCCNHVAAENRKTRDVFSCVACGHTEHADINAAKNILAVGLIPLPIKAAGHAVSVRGAKRKRGVEARTSGVTPGITVL